VAIAKVRGKSGFKVILQGMGLLSALRSFRSVSWSSNFYML